MPKWNYVDFETMLEDYPDILYPIGFEDCIMGIVLQSDKTWAVLMDTDKIVDRLVERDSMTRDEAWEFYEYNIAGAYLEDGPAYLIDVVKEYGEDE